jgi:hypothetical protein
VWTELDYQEATQNSLDRRIEFQAVNSGRFHGFYVWFESHFPGGHILSNSPLQDAVCYGRVFFPLEAELAVEAGDVMSAHFSVNLIDSGPVYRWDTDVHGSNGTLRASFRQSTLRSSPLNPAKLRRGAADHVPILGTDGLVDRLVLEAMAEQLPLQVIADKMSAQFPERFPTFSEALKHVSRMSMHYSVR